MFPNPPLSLETCLHLVAFKFCFTFFSILSLDLRLLDKVLILSPTDSEPWYLRYAANQSFAEKNLYFTISCVTWLFFVSSQPGENRGERLGEFESSEISDPALEFSQSLPTFSPGYEGSKNRFYFFYDWNYCFPT